MSVSTRKRSKHNLKRADDIKAAPRRIAVNPKIRPPRYFARKALAERVLAAVLLIPGALVIFVAAILVRLTSRGRPIFAQDRVGKNGDVFKMYKIRTMIDGAEDNTGPTWTRPNDPRITFLGKWLRKFHIDEFPQLLNVLRGEMSLVGPRPERPEFVHHFVKCIPDYDDRLAVLPGITGLAQINLPPDRTIDDVRRKLVLDLEYINQAGLLLDLRMLLCTLVRLMGCPGAIAMRLFGLKHEVPESFAAESAGTQAAVQPAGGNGSVSRRETIECGLHDKAGTGSSPSDGNGSASADPAAQEAQSIFASPKPR